MIVNSIIQLKLLFGELALEEFANNMSSMEEWKSGQSSYLANLIKLIGITPIGGGLLSCPRIGGS